MILSANVWTLARYSVAFLFCFFPTLFVCLFLPNILYLVPSKVRVVSNLLSLLILHVSSIFFILIELFKWGKFFFFFLVSEVRFCVGRANCDQALFKLPSLSSGSPPSLPWLFRFRFRHAAFWRGKRGEGVGAAGQDGYSHPLLPFPHLPSEVRVWRICRGVRHISGVLFVVRSILVIIYSERKPDCSFSQRASE